MALRKGTARRERADPDGGLCLLGHLDHEVDSLCAVDAGADHQRRAFGVRQRCGKLLHRGRIGTELAADLARLDRRGRMHPVVDRHGHEGRPAGRLHRRVIGARDRGRHILGPRRLDAVFHIGPGKFRGALGIKKRLQRQDRARLLAGGDDQRRLVAMRGIDVAERVADACARMQIDESGIARGLRITVGHADDGGFLQAQHIIDVIGPVGEERQFGRAGIAEHFFDAEGAQQVEGRVLDGDGFVGWCWPACGMKTSAGPYSVIARRSEAIQSRGRDPGLLRRFAPRNDGGWCYHVATPFIVGCPSAFAVHISMPPPALSLALIENSLPSNSGCRPR